MPIESHEGGVTITGSSGLSMFRLLQLKHALRIEINTGMKASRGGSLLTTINNQFGTSFRRKQPALAFILEKIAEAEEGLREENREAEEARQRHAHGNGEHEGALHSECPPCRASVGTVVPSPGDAPDWA